MRCVLAAEHDLRLASNRRKAEREIAMRILIAGASGAIGRPLVRRLRANQHEVFALTRSPDSAPALKEIGAEPVIADALDAAAVKAAVGRIRPDAVINELTSLPRHYTPAEMKAAAERDRKVRVEGNINLLAVLRRLGRAPLFAAKFRILVCARRGAGERVRTVHLQRVPGSRGQRPHLPGIGSARIGDPGNRVRRATLRILLRPRHLVHARGRYWSSGAATAGSDYR